MNISFCLFVFPRQDFSVHKLITLLCVHWQNIFSVELEGSRKGMASVLTVSGGGEELQFPVRIIKLLAEGKSGRSNLGKENDLSSKAYFLWDTQSEFISWWESSQLLRVGSELPGGCKKCAEAPAPRSCCWLASSRRGGAVVFLKGAPGDFLSC